MTAVLSPIDPLATRGRMADDNDFSYSFSNTDWRAKYNEVADMLAETRAELDDFHHASKELEAELENELQRTEKAQQELRVKVEKAETERDQWKSKFVSLQTTHNTTTTSLQRELDKLRQEHQQLKVQFRELEMGNDDLERNERAVSSSLADVEAKYSKALEEKILLEHELLDKANVEEQCQRLKDELRDANVEISVMRDQITALSEAQQQPPTPGFGSEVDLSTPASSIPSTSEEDLLSMQPPLDMQLSDLTPNFESDSPILTTPRAAASNTSAHDDLVRKGSKLVSPTQISRATTLPTLSPAIRSARPATSRPLTSHITSAITAAAVPAVSRNKGVQMVSEMRARVKNLEQKIHTRVPRLRMANITARVASQSQTNIPPSTSLDKPIPEESPFYSTDTDSGPGNKKGGDSTGWVLIMEDSPSPPKKQDRERRRISSPSRRFVSASAAKNSPNQFGTSRIGSLNQSAIAPRRPASRQSGESLSTETTASSISRPTTPTMLPLATPAFHNTQYGTGSKRSTGPFHSQKRPSLGASMVMSPPSETPPNSIRNRQATMPMPSRAPSATPSSASSNRSKTESDTAVPKIPSLYSNMTLRVSTRVPPSSSSTSTLTQSRIGKPNIGRSGRRSVGERKMESNFFEPSKSTFKSEGRPRSGSAAEPRY